MFTSFTNFWWEKWNYLVSPGPLSYISCCFNRKVCPTLWAVYPTRLLCPWDSPGKNTGVGCHFLLQGIFLTQGSNPGLLHCRQILLPSEPPGNLMGYQKCQKLAVPEKPRKGNWKTGYFFFLVNSTISWSAVCVFGRGIIEANACISDPDVSIKWITWNGIFSLLEQNHVRAAQNERCPGPAFGSGQVFITAKVESLHYSLALPEALSFQLGWNRLSLKTKETYVYQG